MSHKEHIMGREIYNPVSPRPSVGGMKQYKVASTLELAGRTLVAHLDGLEPVCVQFLDGENLLWSHPGEAMRWETYEAAKGDERLYLIKFVLSGSKPVTHITLIWDEDTKLVTCIKAVLGADEKRPRLVDSQVFFGAQKIPHEPLTEQRHGFTEDLLGKRIVWRYNPNDEIMHCYCGKNYFRLGLAKRTLAENASEEAKARYQRFVERQGIYTVYEEPAYYIKLRDGFYLYSVTEKNVNRLLPNQGGNQLIILLNAYRVRYIGRVFGYHEDGTLENDFIGAIGKFWPEPDEAESFPYPMYPPEEEKQSVSGN